MTKQFLFTLFSHFNIDRFINLFHKSPVVLFYHGVSETPDPVIETESISVTDFTFQMEYLKKHYHVVSVQEFEDRFMAKKWEGNEVLLTFDDGYKNMLSTALPILEEYGFPFVLFLTTNNISRGELFATTINRLVVLASSLEHLQLHSCNMDTPLTSQNRTMVADNISKQLKSRSLRDVRTIVEELSTSISKDEMNNLRERYPSINPMNWSEAKQVAASPLCAIGSHCVDHICCHANQKSEDVIFQIQESKRFIEEQLGIDCEYFSYPNGNFTEQSNKAVEDAGYHLGFSTKRMPIQALTQWNIPRLYVPYDYARFVYFISTYPKK